MQTVNELKKRKLGVLLVAGMAGLAVYSANAADFCCVCKGQSTGKSIQAGDDLAAGFQCSVVCRRPTIPKAGACEAAGTQPPAAVAPPTAAAAAVLLYKSEDCSGGPATLAKSTGNLAEQSITGIYSFSVQAGGPASVWEKVGYSGQHTEFVGPTLCVSPGWEIKGLQLKGQ